MVGDLFLQEVLPQTAELAAVRSSLASADIAFSNLETPVSTRGAPTEKWINMRMPPELLTDVIDLGFDIVTLANNHMMDFGEVAFYDTLNHLRDRESALCRRGSRSRCRLARGGDVPGRPKSGLPRRGFNPGSGFCGDSARTRLGTDTHIGVVLHGPGRQPGAARQRTLRLYSRLAGRPRPRYRRHCISARGIGGFRRACAALGRAALSGVLVFRMAWRITSLKSAMR